MIIVKQKNNSKSNNTKQDEKKISKQVYRGNKNE